MTALLIQFAGPLLAILGAILGGAGLWYGGKAKARAVAQQEAAEQRAKDAKALAVKIINDNKAANKAEVDSVVMANENIADINAMSDAAVLDELRNNWTKR